MNVGLCTSFEPDGNEIRPYPIGLIPLRSCYVIAN